MDKKLLGRKINVARKDLGLTSEKLSEACHLNATYLRQIEAGTKIPSLPVFVLLCEKLRVSPSYLLSEVLDYNFQEMDLLFEIWKKATPKQIKIITTVLKNILDIFDELRE